MTVTLFFAILVVSQLHFAFPDMMAGYGFEPLMMC